MQLDDTWRRTVLGRCSECGHQDTSILHQHVLTVMKRWRYLQGIPALPRPEPEHQHPDRDFISQKAVGIQSNPDTDRTRTPPAKCRRSRTMSRPAMPASCTSLQLTETASMNRVAITSTVDASHANTSIASASSTTSTTAWSESHRQQPQNRNVDINITRGGQLTLHASISQHTSSTRTSLDTTVVPARSHRVETAVDEQQDSSLPQHHNRSAPPACSRLGDRPHLLQRSARHRRLRHWPVHPAGTAHRTWRCRCHRDCSQRCCSREKRPSKL